MADQEISLFSPEAVLMLTIAIIVDLVGLLEFIPVAGSVISAISDISGIILFGTWTFIRSQKVEVTARAAGRVAKVGKWAKRLRWLRPLCFIGEFIPFVGIIPLWTLLVYFELKS